MQSEGMMNLELVKTMKEPDLNTNVRVKGLAL